jgi:serine/threonine protein kinase
MASASKNYQTLKLVATGGTAVLYKAIQTSLDRVVAVKKLHQHLTEDENFTRRFVLEAKAAASLDHDNIVKIIDFGKDEDSYYMVMEFIEGESVREILDRWKQLPVDVSLAIVHQVCQGLEHAHAKGIVHRDIKPGNIMVTRSGKCKITDFGLAKLTQTTTQHTAANSILGTPLYMSPEQAFGESVDQRSDLFSLGTMLYEMITGVQPFRDENYMGVIQNIINRNAPHPSKFNIEVPTSVQSLLSKAMNKSREARFQTAADFRKAIEKYLGFQLLNEASESVKHLLNADGATVMLPKTARNQQRQSRLRRGFTAALVVATLFGAAGFGYTVAPGAFHRPVQEIMSWVGRGHSNTPIQQSSMQPGQILDSIIPANADSGLAAVGARDSLGAALADSVRAPAPIDVGVKRTAADTTTASTQGSATPTPVKMPGSTPPAATKSAPAPEEKAPAPRLGWLSIKVDPWAEIYVDGRYRGDSPPSLRVELSSGVHSVECRNPKYETYREDVHITQGELSNRNVIMKKLLGVITIITTPGAEIYIDGVLKGIAPLTRPVEVDAGSHLVTLKKPGFNTWNNTVTVVANEQLPLNITLSPMY